MPDREKVIKGLEICSDCGFCESIKKFDLRCPYRNNDGKGCDRSQLLMDSLALLKEQKAVEPKTEPSAKGYWYTCGACGWWLFQVCDTVHFDDRKRIRFCASCGRAVKWG